MQRQSESTELYSELAVINATKWYLTALASSILFLCIGWVVAVVHLVEVLWSLAITVTLPTILTDLPHQALVIAFLYVMVMAIPVTLILPWYASRWLLRKFRSTVAMD